MPLKSIKQNKQLPAHYLSIEIYSGIAQFPGASTALLLVLLLVLFLR